jgi:hypothetical protein
VDAALDQGDRQLLLGAASGVNAPVRVTASASIGRPSGVRAELEALHLLRIGLLERAHSLMTSS